MVIVIDNFQHPAIIVHAHAVDCMQEAWRYELRGSGCCSISVAKKRNTNNVVWNYSGLRTNPDGSVV